MKDKATQRKTNEIFRPTKTKYPAAQALMDDINCELRRIEKAQFRLRILVDTLAARARD